MEELTIQINNLNKMFDKFNEHYYRGKLPKVVITIQNDFRAYGYFTVNRVWSLSEIEKRHEINISSYYLNRNKYALCSTLLHEMIHLYAHENGIQDTSRQGRYHNSDFKRLAESVDLKIDKANLIGWSVTSPTQKLKDFIDSTKIEFLNLSRLCQEKEPKPPKNKKPTFTYICSKCGLEVKTKKEHANIYCGDCNLLLSISK